MLEACILVLNEKNGKSIIMPITMINNNYVNLILLAVLMVVVVVLAAAIITTTIMVIIQIQWNAFISRSQSKWFGSKLANLVPETVKKTAK